MTALTAISLCDHPKDKLLTTPQRLALVTDVALAVLAIAVGTLVILQARGIIDLSQIAKIGTHLSKVETLGIKTAWAMIGAGGGVIVLDSLFILVKSVRRASKLQKERWQGRGTMAGSGRVDDQRVTATRTEADTTQERVAALETELAQARDELAASLARQSTPTGEADEGGTAALAAVRADLETAITAHAGCETRIAELEARIAEHDAEAGALADAAAELATLREAKTTYEAQAARLAELEAKEADDQAAAAELGELRAAKETFEAQAARLEELEAKEADYQAAAAELGELRAAKETFETQAACLVTIEAEKAELVAYLLEIAPSAYSGDGETSLADLPLKEQLAALFAATEKATSASAELLAEMSRDLEAAMEAASEHAQLVDEHAALKTEAERLAERVEELSAELAAATAVAKAATTQAAAALDAAVGGDPGLAKQVEDLTAQLAVADALTAVLEGDVVKSVCKQILEIELRTASDSKKTSLQTTIDSNNVAVMAPRALAFLEDGFVDLNAQLTSVMDLLPSPPSGAGDESTYIDEVTPVLKEIIQLAIDDADDPEAARLKGVMRSSDVEALLREALHYMRTIAEQDRPPSPIPFSPDSPALFFSPTPSSRRAQTPPPRFSTPTNGFPIPIELSVEEERQGVAMLIKLAALVQKNPTDPTLRGALMEALARLLAEEASNSGSSESGSDEGDNAPGPIAGIALKLLHQLDAADPAVIKSAVGELMEEASNADSVMLDRSVAEFMASVCNDLHYFNLLMAYGRDEQPEGEPKGEVVDTWSLPFLNESGNGTSRRKVKIPRSTYSEVLKALTAAELEQLETTEEKLETLVGIFRDRIHGYTDRTRSPSPSLNLSSLMSDLNSSLETGATSA